VHSLPWTKQSACTPATYCTIVCNIWLLGSSNQHADVMQAVSSATVYQNLFTGVPVQPVFLQLVAAAELQLVAAAELAALHNVLL
jgi:hypothetical protein